MTLAFMPAAVSDRVPSLTPRYDKLCAALAEAKAVDEVKGIHDTAKAMSAAARIAKNKQAEADMMAIRFAAERRLGELMAAQRDIGELKVGNPNGFEKNPLDKPITLSEAGIDKNLADRARKYAAIPEQEFNDRVDEYRRRVSEEGDRARADLLDAGDKHVRGTFGTGENEWYTPDDYLDLARLVLGEIDLDPASSAKANERIEAKEIFTLADNGLSKEWHGRLWLNPPYSQPAIAEFADKMVSEWQAGRIIAAIVLTHNYTDTSWFQKLAHAATSICFTRGRVRFVSPDGELAAPTQGQAFFYFGPDGDIFADVFEQSGFVVEVAR